jgi:hypothetical protein
MHPTTMVRRLLLPALAITLAAQAQQPPTPSDAFATLADQPATHTSFTYDRSMMEPFIGNSPEAAKVLAAVNSITVQTFRYKQPAFYTPEAMAAIIKTYNANGWKHLVNGNTNPGQSAQPTSVNTDLWLHFAGTEIDDVTVLLRAPKNMTVIDVAGLLRPLDLVHLSGHFGIPKVDPNAVMIAAPPGK